LGTVIDAQQINNLPVNGRLFQTLMFLAPGTTPAAWGDQIENPAAAGSTAPGGGGGGTYSSVNGFPFQGNLYLVDSVLNVEPQNAYITIAIPFENIAEMKMETNNPTAEYGTFGGAVVNLTTADFLVGGPSAVDRDLFPSSPATRVTYLGVFGQDDLRLNQKLTVNLGFAGIFTRPLWMPTTIRATSLPVARMQG
jgi:hypothetical protein